MASLTAIAKRSRRLHACTSACAVAHQEHDFLHSTGAPDPGQHHFAESLSEDGLLTFRVATPPSTQSQLQRHRLALNGTILRFLQ